MRLSVTDAYEKGRGSGRERSGAADEFMPSSSTSSEGLGAGKQGTRRRGGALYIGAIRIELLYRALYLGP